MADIEEQRLANVRNKEKLLAELNLGAKIIQTTRAQTTQRDKGAVVKKRKVEAFGPPTRSSTRLQQGTRVSYKEEPDSFRGLVEKKTPSSRRANAEASVMVEAKLEPAPDVDEIRDGWSKWEAVAVPPTRDEVGTFHFDDFPTFTPNKSPEEMIREGSFGGSYWRPLKSRRLGIIVQDDWKELPPSWIDGLDVDAYLTNTDYDADINKYKVACGQSIEEWEASGWIMHEYDVRGWFQWYCRFFQGRRCPDDERQVSRWKKCVGPTGRWKRMLLKAYLKSGVRDVFDDGEDEESIEVSPVMHQTCHHWGVQISQHDLDEAWMS